MKVTRKFRNQILNTVAAASMAKLQEHCPHAMGDIPPEGWPDDGTRERFDLITEVTTEIERRVDRFLIASMT